MKSVSSVFLSTTLFWLLLFAVSQLKLDFNLINKDLIFIVATLIISVFAGIVTAKVSSSKSMWLILVIFLLTTAPLTIMVILVHGNPSYPILITVTLALLSTLGLYLGFKYASQNT